MGHSITFSSLKEFMRQGLQPVECPICQEEIGAERPIDQDSEYPSIAKISRRSSIVETPCNHQFHRGCLLDWVLGQQKQHCPYCKHMLFTATTKAKYQEQVAEEARQSQNLAERQNLLHTVEEQSTIVGRSNEDFRRKWSAVQRELGRVRPDDLSHPFARARARAWMLEMGCLCNENTNHTCLARHVRMWLGGAMF